MLDWIRGSHNDSGIPDASLPVSEALFLRGEELVRRLRGVSFAAVSSAAEERPAAEAWEQEGERVRVFAREPHGCLAHALRLEGPADLARARVEDRAPAPVHEESSSAERRRAHPEQVYRELLPHAELDRK